MFNIADNILVYLNHSANVTIVAVQWLLLRGGKVVLKLLYHGRIKILLILEIFQCQIGVNCCILVDKLQRDTE